MSYNFSFYMNKDINTSTCEKKGKEVIAYEKPLYKDI
jgi:hypothetical protein